MSRCNLIISKTMQIKIFDISSRGSEDAQDQINKFMRQHKVLDVDRQFYVSSDNIGHWSVFVTYLPMPQQQASQGNTSERREKTDYKAILSEVEFEKFTKLRAIRKQLAADDAVPAYAVFTDAELAQMARMPQVDATSISKISGIGEKRIEKYGRLLCALFETETE